jgi:hypothetical protein
VPLLPPGEYRVEISAKGFVRPQRLVVSYLYDLPSPQNHENRRSHKAGVIEIAIESTIHRAPVNQVAGLAAGSYLYPVLIEAVNSERIVGVGL